MTTTPTLLGGIDLGGTKIEACLFDAQLQPVARQRVNTPRSSYAALLDALVGQCQWLGEQAGDARLPIGLGLPGVVDRHTGLLTTANLAAMGRPLPADLSARLGRAVPMENDCKCFALSEAVGGAGDGFDVVFGLILGTGVGGGLCRNGELLTHHNGTSGEVGHIPIPAHLAAQMSLPVLPCGCGRTGCYELWISGPGMSRLCQHVTGQPLAAPDIVAGAAAGDASLQTVFSYWLSLLCELMQTLQLALDPNCIVLGGGLSGIEGLAQQLTQAFPGHQIKGLQAPQFRQARFGDSSGVRGAAMLARGLP